MPKNQCQHERNPRTCRWCAEGRSTSMGFPLEVAQLAHSWRSGPEFAPAGELSTDARREYAVSSGKDWPKQDRHQDEVTDWNNRHLLQVGEPWPDEQFDPYW